MVKTKNYFLNPISRQNFANTFAVTHNLNLELCPRLVLKEKNLGWFVKFGVIVGFHSSQLLADEQRKPLGGKVSFFKKISMRRK